MIAPIQQVLLASLSFLISFVLLSFQDTVICHRILNLRKNDYQPEELDDEVVTDMSNTQYDYSKQKNLPPTEKFKMP